MNNPVSNMAVDLWYKVLIAVGSASFLLTLTIDVKVANNEIMSLISLGILLFGVGEWINHPVHAEVKGNGILQYVKRSNRPLGIILVIVASSLFITGAIKLIAYSPCTN